jgi:PIN domain nuclease of toxin-antitoxin system
LSFVYLDTHIAADLYAGRLRDLTADAKRHIEKSDLLISPMVFLELGYLYQLNRVREGPRKVLAGLIATFGVSVCQIPFAAVTDHAVDIGWTNDPFDRVIVAQAIANNNAKLITRDGLMREHYSGAIW